MSASRLAVPECVVAPNCAPDASFKPCLMLGPKLTPAVNDVAANAAIVDTKISLGTAIQAYDADTAKTDVAQNWSKGQRGAITALTDGANIATDLSLSNNFSVTLAGNRTLDNPTNIVAGQSGSIFVTQDGTGSRTLAVGDQYFGAGGEVPTISTDANAIDVIPYIVIASGKILLGAAQLAFADAS